jgi:hypothetical protein
MLGWINSGLDEQYGPYVVDRADHFLFNVPEADRAQKRRRVRAFGRRQAARRQRPRNRHPAVDAPESSGRKPAPVPVPDEPAGITTLATGRIPWKIPGKEQVYSGESLTFSCAGSTGAPAGAEMIYWERAGGGKVFNAGAIRAAGPCTPTRPSARWSGTCSITSG